MNNARNVAIIGSVLYGSLSILGALAFFMLHGDPFSKMLLRANNSGNNCSVAVLLFALLILPHFLFVMGGVLPWVCVYYSSNHLRNINNHYTEEEGGTQLAVAAIVLVCVTGGLFLCTMLYLCCMIECGRSFYWYGGGQKGNHYGGTFFENSRHNGNDVSPNRWTDRTRNYFLFDNTREAQNNITEVQENQWWIDPESVVDPPIPENYNNHNNNGITGYHDTAPPRNGPTSVNNNNIVRNTNTNNYVDLDKPISYNNTSMNNNAVNTNNHSINNSTAIYSERPMRVPPVMPPPTNNNNNVYNPVNNNMSNRVPQPNNNSSGSRNTGNTAAAANRINTNTIGIRSAPASALRSPNNNYNSNNRNRNRTDSPPVRVHPPTSNNPASMNHTMNRNNNPTFSANNNNNNNRKSVENALYSPIASKRSVDNDNINTTNNNNNTAVFTPSPMISPFAWDEYRAQMKRENSNPPSNNNNNTNVGVPSMHYTNNNPTLPLQQTSPSRLHPQRKTLTGKSDGISPQRTSTVTFVDPNSDPNDHYYEEAIDLDVSFEEQLTEHRKLF